MSVNKYRPHVFVLPEDDANRQLANGFILDRALDTRKIQILEEAGGWYEVLNRFAADHVASMDEYPERRMVLLIDFDGHNDRLSTARELIPERLRQRVFFLGARTQPEELRQCFGSYETIGLNMARDCREDTEETWGHHLLEHNAEELQRLRQIVRPILFSQ